MAAGGSTNASIAVLEGALLKSHSFFPYYLLVALEAGSPLRACVLLAAYPFIVLASKFFSDAAAVHMLVFISMIGLRLSDVRGVAKAVLPKFLMEDMNQMDACRAFLRCKKKVVLTCHPRLMVEHFLSFHLGVDKVFGTELCTTEHGLCTGFVAEGGVLVDERQADAVTNVLHKNPMIVDVGLGCRPSHNLFLSFCKEKFVVSTADSKDAHVSLEAHYQQPLVFHDGRLVRRPTPLACLSLLLWAPFGVLLGLLRFVVAMGLPKFIAHPCLAFLGFKVRVRSAPPLDDTEEEHCRQGVLFVCTHRTPVDPLFVAAALRRRSVRALTYSVSRSTELLSPIRTTRLTRRREKDMEIIGRLLAQQEDLVMCPEGTTCREPFLLRFSGLFAEVAERVVPIAVDARMGLFHPTSARGYKWLDPLFLILNPQPMYDITFLDAVRPPKLREEGKSSAEIANLVQKQLADALGFRCTSLTRRDKYTLLAGNNGMV